MADAIREREASLARSEERLRATIENAPSVAIQWYDRDAICRYWNPASTAIYGFTREETVGRSLVGMFWTEAQKDEFVELMREIERTGEPTPPTEFAIRHKDGRHGHGARVGVRDSRCARRPPVRLSRHRHHRTQARRERTVRQPAGTGNDLQRLASANVGLRSRARLPHHQGQRRLGTQVRVRQFGRFGKTGSEVGMYPEDRGPLHRAIHCGVGAYDDMELWLRHADGAQFLARVSARVVEVAGQRLMLMASEDITEERRMQAELRGVNEALEARVLQRTAALTQSNNELAAAMET